MSLTPLSCFSSSFSPSLSPCLLLSLSGCLYLSLMTPFQDCLLFSLPSINLLHSICCIVEFLRGTPRHSPPKGTNLCHNLSYHTTYQNDVQDDSHARQTTWGIGHSFCHQVPAFHICLLFPTCVATFGRVHILLVYTFVEWRVILSVI